MRAHSVRFTRKRVAYAYAYGYGQTYSLLSAIE
jgi:hypothetical protein